MNDKHTLRLLANSFSKFNSLSLITSCPASFDSIHRAYNYYLMSVLNVRYFLYARFLLQSFTHVSH